MEMVPRSPRREKARVRGREWVSRSDGSLEGEGAHKGERAYGKVPRNRGKNTTLLASMSLHGMGATMVVEGATDAEAFEVYAEHFLAPSLREGQVVVFDNLGAHEPRRVRELIEARGAEVLFLPSYCPDSNPIEEAFSKIKGIVGKAGARTREAFTRSDSASALGHHARGRGRVVFSFWLRGRGSMLMNTAVTVVCWKRKRRVRWDGTTGGDKPRRAIELPREAPSSTFPILREPAATVFNKVPLIVVCCFRKKCLLDSHINNLSCPLQALNREGQQEANDL